MSNRKIREQEFMDMITENVGIILKISGAYARTASEREDLVAEIIFSLWKSFPSFKGYSKKSTWLYRVTLNTALSHKKREQLAANILYLDPTELPSVKLIEYDTQTDKLLEKLYTSIEKLGDFDKAIVQNNVMKKEEENLHNVWEQVTENIGSSATVNKKIPLETFSRKIKKNTVTLLMPSVIQMIVYIVLLTVFYIRLPLSFSSTVGIVLMFFTLLALVNITLTLKKIRMIRSFNLDLSIVSFEKLKILYGKHNYITTLANSASWLFILFFFGFKALHTEGWWQFYRTELLGVTLLVVLGGAVIEFLKLRLLRNQLKQAETKLARFYNSCVNDSPDTAP